MSTDAPRHLSTRALTGIDLGIVDSRITWARSASASSEYSSSYAAATVTGPPRVFPRGGDISGAWLAENSDEKPWLEVGFPRREQAVALIVCETCGPGAISEIKDLETGQVIYRAKPKVLRPSRKARLLWIPLGEAVPPTRLRIELAGRSFGAEYHEIDAVGLIGVELEELVADPPRWGPTRHRRHAPKEVKKIGLRSDPRVHWAHKARASSQYSSSYSAHKAVGPPNVFPKGGDKYETWLPEGSGHDEWIELHFALDQPVHGIIVLETCGAGATYKITADDGEVLWQAPPEKVPERKARLLHVELELRPAPERIRLWLSGTVTDYRQIDAVALISAPFDTLDEPPPPPPTLEEQGRVLKGVLVGASEHTPLVHATLRTPKHGYVRISAGPLHLRLEDGTEVPLDVGQAILHGPARTRHRGPFSEIADEAPWLAAPFPDVAPDGETIASLEGRRITEELAVEILGEVERSARGGGFRSAAQRMPTACRATLITTGTLDEIDDPLALRFDEGARALPQSTFRPHALRNWSRGIAVCALAELAAGLACLHYSGEGHDILGAVLMLLAVVTFTFAIEFVGRMNVIPVFQTHPGAGRKDRAVPWTQPGLLLFGWGSVLSMVGLLLAAPLASLAGETPWTGGAAAICAVFALIRLVAWQRRALRSLFVSLRLLLTSRGPSAAGSRARFEGVLASGAQFRRTEKYMSKVKHLGTYTRTDEEGKTTTHDSYKSWYERHISANGPSQVSLIDNGVAVRTEAPRTTDIALQNTGRGVDKGIYAWLEGNHEDGDPATLIGRVESAGDEVVLGDATLVLGRFSELRYRVFVQLAVLALLSSIVIGGALIARASWVSTQKPSSRVQSSSQPTLLVGATPESETQRRKG